MRRLNLDSEIYVLCILKINSVVKAFDPDQNPDSSRSTESTSMLHRKSVRGTGDVVSGSP